MADLTAYTDELERVLFQALTMVGVEGDMATLVVEERRTDLARIVADAEQRGYQRGLRANPSEGHNAAWEDGYNHGRSAGLHESDCPNLPARADLGDTTGGDDRSRYPSGYPACIMCGAEAGEACTVISTVHDEFYDQDAGDRREQPHAYRAKPGQPGPTEPFVAVKDEPNYAPLDVLDSEGANVPFPDRTDIALAEVQRTLVNLDPRLPLSTALDVVTRMRVACREASDNYPAALGDTTGGDPS